MHNLFPTRREFLTACSTAGLTASWSLRPSLVWAAEANDGGPLAPKPGHFEAKAKHLVFVFLTGGFSHVDTFDPKPKLAADSGKTVTAQSLRDVTTQPLLGSPFAFSNRGQSGLPISELFPNLGVSGNVLKPILA